MWYHNSIFYTQGSTGGGGSILCQPLDDPPLHSLQGHQPSVAKGASQKQTVCILSSFTFVWQDVFPTGLQTFPESFSSWPDLTDWPLLDRKVETYSQVGWRGLCVFALLCAKLRICRNMNGCVKLNLVLVLSFSVPFLRMPDFDRVDVFA